jgi:anti-sigma factor RsiW
MPKATPDLIVAAERYLDGEMTAVQIAEFESRLKKDKNLRELLREMRFARKAMNVYRTILPPAAEFKAIRKAVLAEI